MLPFFSVNPLLIFQLDAEHNRISALQSSCHSFENIWTELTLIHMGVSLGVCLFLHKRNDTEDKAMPPSSV